MRLVVRCLLTLTLIASSCSSGASAGGQQAALPEVAPELQQEVDNETQASLSQTPSAQSSVSLTNLLSDYYALSGLLTTAQTMEANECMIQLGFEPMPIILPPERPEFPQYVGELGRLALTESGARSEGYASTVLSLQNAFEDPREQLQTSLDPVTYGDAWFEAWRGETVLPPAPSEMEEGQTRSPGSAGGCFFDAAIALENGTSDDDVFGALQTAESLWSDVYSLAEEDERYRDALERWSLCMRERGFGGFEELIDAYVVAQDLRTSDPAREVEQAINDARCQAESGVIDEYASVWLEHEASVQSSNEALQFFSWHRENFESIMQQVQRILNSAG